VGVNVAAAVAVIVAVGGVVRLGSGKAVRLGSGVAVPVEMVGDAASGGLQADKKIKITNKYTVIRITQL
jgi:hypothetical protein